MRKSQSSMTAVGIAMVRAIESEEPTVKRGEVSKMRRDRWLSNEVLAFGIPEGTVGSFLEQRGFTQVHDANFKYLHDTYFTGAKARRTVADGYAMCRPLSDHGGPDENLSL